jgi:hypothetical protein
MGAIWRRTPHETSHSHSALPPNQCHESQFSRLPLSVPSHHSQLHRAWVGHTTIPFRRRPRSLVLGPCANPICSRTRTAGSPLSPPTPSPPLLPRHRHATKIPRDHRIVPPALPRHRPRRRLPQRPSRIARRAPRQPQARRQRHRHAPS